MSDLTRSELSKTETLRKGLSSKSKIPQKSLSSKENSRIQSLPSDVIDQIAAGEVVDRPAHMVKELVENAIDAGAKLVQVEVDNGGRTVKVVDDGRGIASEDLKLALSRHATSKIEKAADLWEISSFGFRGEALASIAAVSKLTLVSKTADQETASSIVSDFGKLSEVASSGGTVGTSIHIDQLFENVPARLKFLKTDSGEVSQIKNMLKALALAHPEVGFRFKSKGKLQFFWAPSKNFLERSKSVLEKERLYSAEGGYENYKCTVNFTAPNDVFGNSRQIWIFVQNRWVQDRSLQAAVQEAFRGLLMHGEFPIAVVSLNCDPEDVDVNVHPTKSQVKFRDPKSAFRAVNRTLREELEKAPWLESVLGSNGASNELGETQRADLREARHQQSVVEKSLEFKDSNLNRTQYLQKNSEYQTPSISKSRVEQATERYSTHYSDKNADEIQKKYVFRSSIGGEASNFRDQANANAEKSTSSSFSPTMKIEPSIVNAESPSIFRWQDLQVLGQANLTYIVAQSSEKIFYVDQHAAHERVAYEKLMHAWREGEHIDIQPFLLPLTFELEPDSAEALISVSEDLKKMGVEVELSGPTTIAVSSKPVLLKENGLVKALTKLAEEVRLHSDGFAFENAVAHVCATMACHSVVRAGQSLSHAEMKALLEGMDEFALSSFCPHGRPVFVEYSFSKLEKDFGRIV